MEVADVSMTRRRTGCLRILQHRIIGVLFVVIVCLHMIVHINVTHPRVTAAQAPSAAKFFQKGQIFARSRLSPNMRSGDRKLYPLHRNRGHYVTSNTPNAVAEGSQSAGATGSNNVVAPMYSQASTVFTIAGDIGGTNSRFALFRSNLKEEGIGEMVFNKKYKNTAFSSFSQAVKSFIDEATSGTESGLPRDSKQIVSGAFAIAGPVLYGTVKFTNLDWPSVSATELSQELGIQTEIINDFVGLSQGLVTLEDSDTVTIHKGKRIPRAPKFCIGAGTGLGEAFLTFNDELGEYEAWPSEGGHSDFVPRTEEQLEMAGWIRKKIYPSKLALDIGARISVERVCSGGGLINTYEYLKHKYPEEIDPTSEAEYELADPKQKPAVISKWGVKNMDSLMGRTIQIFLFTLGSEVANACLKFLPFGGVYIAGGIVPKLLDQVAMAEAAPESCDIDHPEMCEQSLLSGFEIYKTLKRDAKNKGRMGELLSKVPVLLVTGPKVDTIAINGAQIVAKRIALRLAKERVEESV
ncbi:hypothetical protein AAMO2058_000783200 [Amorphochlora amoebiformis]